eukprot:2259198-Amphidinium_carterae.1
MRCLPFSRYCTHRKKCPGGGELRNSDAIGEGIARADHPEKKLLMGSFTKDHGVAYIWAHSSLRHS